MKAVFDTNILGDYLGGVKKAKKELARYETRLISIITWMEAMVASENEDHEKIIRRFLSGFGIIQISPQIAERAVMLRKRNKIKLPDAIILATAQELGALLITRNTRDFDAREPGIRVPYKL